MDAILTSESSLPDEHEVGQSKFGQAGAEQVRDLLDRFKEHCEIQMDRVKEQIFAHRPRLSRLTIALGIVVTLLSIFTSWFLIASGAATDQLLLLSIGEVFLFGLVVASGLSDLFWRDPSKLLLAKEDQLARVAGINDKILALHELRLEWERDLDWHRAKCGDKRQLLASLELTSVAMQSEIEKHSIELNELRRKAEQGRADESLFSELLSERRETLQQQEAKIVQCQQQLDGETAKLDQVRTDLQNLKADHERLVHEQQITNEQISSHKASIENLQGDIGDLQVEKAAVQREVEVQLSELVVAQDATSKAKEQLTETTSQLKEQLELAEFVNQALSDFTDSLQFAQGKVDKTVGLTRLLQQTLEARHQRTISLEKRVEELHGEITACVSSKVEIEQDLVSLGEKRATIAASLESLALIEKEKLEAVSRLESQHAELETCVQITSRRLQHLEYSADEMEKRISLGSEQLLSLCSAIEDGHRQQQLHEEKESSLQQQLDSLTISIDERNANVESLCLIIQGLEREIAVYDAIYKRLESECCEAETKLEGAKANIELADSIYAQRLTEIESLNWQIADQQREVLEQSQKVRLAEATIAEVASQLISLRSEVLVLQAEVEGNAETYREELANLKLEVLGAEQQLADLQSECSDVEQVIAKSRLQLDGLDQQFAASMSNLKQLDEEANAKRKVASDYEANLCKLKLELDDVAIEVDKRLADVRREVIELEDKCAVLEQTGNELVDLVANRIRQKDELDQLIDEGNAALVSLAREVDSNRELLADLSNKRMSVEQQLQAQAIQQQKAEAQIQNLTASLLHLRTEVLSVRDEFRNHTRDVSNEIEKLQSARIVAEAELAEKLQDLLYSSRELSEIENRRCSEQESLAKLQGELHESSIALETVNQQRIERELELESVHVLFLQHTKACEQAERELSSLINRLDQCQAEFRRAEEDHEVRLLTYAQSLKQVERQAADERERQLVLEAGNTQLREDQLRLEDEILTLQDQIETLRSETAARALEIEREFDERRQRRDEELCTLSHQVQQKQVQLANLVAELDRVSGEIQVAANELSSNRERSDAIAVQINEGEANLLSLSNQMKQIQCDTQEVIFERQQRKDLLSSEIDKLQAGVDSLVQIQGEHCRLNDELEKERMNLAEQHMQLTAAIGAQIGELRSLEERTALVSAEASEAEQRLLVASGEYSRLNE